jgi:hypothetical protein
MWCIQQASARPALGMPAGQHFSWYEKESQIHLGHPMLPLISSIQ